MTRLRTPKIALLGATCALGTVLLAGCEPGHKQTAQWGPPGAALDQIVDARHVTPPATIPDAPYPLPADSGPPASQSYQNVKVLGGLSTDRFNYLMAEISQWIAPPEQGCAYCHNPANMASDEKYTKVVARRMIQMTQGINSQWSNHVHQTGVTCYTCHRGNAVPQYKWALSEGEPHPDSILGNRHGQNAPNPEVANASLPSDMYAQYLYGHANIRVAGNDPFPQPDHVVSVKTAEQTYGLMMHVSKSLGVNCTYCHNTQSFRAWDLSSPKRATAWYGIRMVRDINNTYISSLQSVFPDNRKGPMGDPYKVNCMTCHQGVYKPLGGVSMLSQVPMLKGPIPMPGVTASATPAAPAATASTTPAAAMAPMAMPTGAGY